MAISGMLTEVGGKIFETRSRKTTRARRIEINKDQCQKSFDKNTEKLQRLKE